MPIRFRCQYCNQLLGISRRKAGTHVDCPTCHAQVMVPSTDPNAAAAAAPAATAAPAAQQEAPLFERSDFDEILRPGGPPPPAALPPLPPPALPMGDRPSAYDVDRLDPGVLAPSGVARPPGVFLSPTQATVLTVITVFLLAIAFGAGLLVGRYWL